MRLSDSSHVSINSYPVAPPVSLVIYDISCHNVQIDHVIICKLLLSNTSNKIHNMSCVAQSLASREDHIRELQKQVLLLSEGEAARSNEQQSRLGALITSFNQLRETCEQQVGKLVCGGKLGGRVC